MGDASTGLFEHNVWANLALLDTCAALPDDRLDAEVDGTYGTVRATLMHLLAAEERYVYRLGEVELEGPLDQEGPFPGFDDLLRRARRSGDALIRLAREADLDETFVASFGPREHRIPKRVVAVQAINHATEHRAHVVTTLTATGTPPVELDGWSWGYETGSIEPV